MSDERANSPEVDPDHYRRAMGRLAGGVSVVTTFAGRHHHAMTANSMSSVSLDPVLMLVCVEQDARWHEAVVESGVWGVNVLPASARATAEWLATPGRPLHGQLDRIPHRNGPVTGVALLDEAVMRLECRTYAIHNAGDHSIVVGEVVSVETPESSEPALVHYRGRYIALP